MDSELISKRQFAFFKARRDQSAHRRGLSRVAALQVSTFVIKSGLESLGVLSVVFFLL